jgi:hypothetical protein
MNLFKKLHVMKKIAISFWVLTALLFVTVSCETDDIGFYNEEYNSVRFPISTLFSWEPSGYDAGVFFAAYSFIETPFIDDAIYDLPVMLIGQQSNVERKVSYRIDEEKSTAPAGSYNILGAVIPPDTTVGYIRVQIFNREELNDTTYQLSLILQESDQLSLGLECVNAILSWNNSIPMPSHNNLRRTYNMLIKSSLNFISTSTANYSPNALKAIVAALGWNDWDDQEKHGAKYNSATYGSYKYLPRYNMIYTDNSYKAYAFKLANYIKAYNEANPDALLRHDAGGLKGELIEARSY